MLNFKKSFSHQKMHQKNSLRYFNNMDQIYQTVPALLMQKNANITIFFRKNLGLMLNICTIFITELSTC